VTDVGLTFLTVRMTKILRFAPRVAGLLLACWLMLRPEWSVTRGGDLELHINSWFWRPPDLPNGWTATHVRWIGSLVFPAMIIILTWSVWPSVPIVDEAAQLDDAADDAKRRS
jgi:hypothetical protein